MSSEYPLFEMDDVSEHIACTTAGKGSTQAISNGCKTRTKIMTAIKTRKTLNSADKWRSPGSVWCQMHLVGARKQAGRGRKGVRCLAQQFSSALGMCQCWASRSKAVAQWVLWLWHEHMSDAVYVFSIILLTNRQEILEILALPEACNEGDLSPSWRKSL